MLRFRRFSRRPFAVARFTSLALILSLGCGDDDDGSIGDATDDTTADDTTADDTTATLRFTIDDRAAKTYVSTDGLAWKGSFNYDTSTGSATYDALWGGPFAPLVDDGTGGDDTAGDNVWTVQMTVDSTTAQTFRYGAIRGSVAGSDGEWIWLGDNGAVTVSAGETGIVEAQGLVIVDPCAGDPCLNGGTCIAGGNGFTCDCADGYGGDRCENCFDSALITSREEDTDGDGVIDSSVVYGYDEDGYG